MPSASAFPISALSPVAGHSKDYDTAALVRSDNFQENSNFGLANLMSTGTVYYVSLPVKETALKLEYNIINVYTWLISYLLSTHSGAPSLPLVSVTVAKPETALSLPVRTVGRMRGIGLHL